VAIFCEVEYMPIIVNPNRRKGTTWWPCTSSASPGLTYARWRFRYDDSS